VAAPLFLDSSGDGVLGFQAGAAFRMGEWNRFRIECQGDVLKTYLNGIPAAELKDSMTSAGFIALQVHSVGKNTNQLEMRWRNIRIQELR
jgi:hypothetical protein